MDDQVGYSIEFIIYYRFLIMKTVQHIIRVVETDTVKIMLTMNGHVNVNFGGMERYAMN